jgi:hypothetical protein
VLHYWLAELEHYAQVYFISCALNCRKLEEKRRADVVVNFAGCPYPVGRPPT